jgi:DNA-binding SARP family transcriptional activator
MRTHAEVVSARARRIAALGEFSGTRVQRLLDDAEEKAAAGLYDAALAAAEQAVSLEPASVEASLTTAAIQRQMGRSVPAITTLRTLVAARAKAGGRVASKEVGRNGNRVPRRHRNGAQAGGQRHHVEARLDPRPGTGRTPLR